MCRVMVLQTSEKLTLRPNGCQKKFPSDPTRSWHYPASNWKLNQVIKFVRAYESVVGSVTPSSLMHISHSPSFLPSVLSRPLYTMLRSHNALFPASASNANTTNNGALLIEFRLIIGVYIGNIRFLIGFVHR